MNKIGFGGSCHWCTEAIFLSLKGVSKVEQGWIAAEGENSGFSEAVVVTYDTETIPLRTLVAIHLYTHSCTSNHSMRSKYRSAVYTLDKEDAIIANASIKELQADYTAPIITKVLPFIDFKVNTQEFLNYYYSNPDKPFCENIVNPKLKMLIKQFSNDIDMEKLKHLQSSAV